MFISSFSFGSSVKSIRILKSSGNAKPLCYDVSLPQKVRLLQNDLSGQISNISYYILGANMYHLRYQYAAFGYKSVPFEKVQPQ